MSRSISGRHLDDQYSGHRYSNPEAYDSTNFVEGLPIPRTGPVQEPRDGEVRGGLSAEDEKDLASLTQTETKNPNLVTWDGPDDPENPKNWTSRRKWAATIIVSLFTLISPVSSSMVAPALATIAEEFGVTNKVEAAMTMSIFVLAYAIAPLFLGPLSEMYGRVIVLQIGNILYLIFNTGCALAKTQTQMILFRFLAGVGGSASLGLGGGVLSDLFISEERGKALGVYSLAPLLGPAIGPIAGSFITANTSWRWIFYSTTIADGLIQFLGLFFLQETYPPVLLQRKKAKLIQETGNSDLYTEWDNPCSVIETLAAAFVRPFRMLGTQIILQLLAIFMAYLYGTGYLIFSTFPTLWTEIYHESTSTGGLNYISLGVGLCIGTQICTPFQGRVYRVLKKRNHGIGRPEFFIPMMIPAALCVPIGLLGYGWAAQTGAHWIWPNIGVGVFAVGMVTGYQCIQTYIVDSYTRYTASAMGAAAVLRSLAGFGFPLFAPIMYEKLHYGWGNSLLALIAIVLGWPAPFLLWRYGEALRKRSPFAAG